MKPAAIECHNITLRHGFKNILEKCSFTIPQGAFTGVIGNNGAGKTTLLKAILALHPIFSGKIEILGSLPSRKIKSSLAYLPQFIPFIPLSGYSLLSLANQKFNKLFFSSHAEREKIDAVLGLVNGHHLAKKPVSSLSGGERQRIFLALALLSQPKILLLDEPFSNLDPAQTENILHLLQKIHREMELTILCSTHQVFSMSSVLTDILCIKDKKAIMGKTNDILNSALIAEIYDLPVNFFKNAKPETP